MSIQQIQPDWPLDDVWDELVYTHARLTKNKHAKDLAPQVTPLFKRWEKVAGQQRALWRAEIEAQAGVDEDDDEIDETVTDVSGTILYREKQKRDSARYKRYFKRPASEIVRLGLESELEVVRDWPASLKTEPESDLQALGKRLEDNVTTGDAAVAERKQAIAGTADHRVREIHPFIAEVNVVRNTLYGTLVTRAGQKKLSPKWPERFFRKAKSGPKAKKKADSTVAPDSVAAAGGTNSPK